MEWAQTSEKVTLSTGEFSKGGTIRLVLGLIAWE